MHTKVAAKTKGETTHLTTMRATPTLELIFRKGVARASWLPLMILTLSLVLPALELSSLRLVDLNGCVMASNIAAWKPMMPVAIFPKVDRGFGITGGNRGSGAGGLTSGDCEADPSCRDGKMGPNVVSRTAGLGVTTSEGGSM